MSNETIAAACDEIDRQTAIIRNELTPEPPDPEPPDPGDYVVVEEGEDLQAALDAGGAVFLAESASFTRSGGYTLRGDTLLGGEGGNTLDGGNSAALIVPVNQRAVAFGRFTPRTSGEVGILIGRNDTQQVTIESSPQDVRVQEIRSSGHRGKRVVEVNARNVLIVDPDIRDAYDPEGQDSQAICILNAPGPVTVEGGHLEAGSEVILVGGDSMKIPNCRPTGLVFREITLTRPMAWRDAGTPRVKNIFELKDGHDVLVERCVLSNCWPSAQDGYAFMLTPTRGGSLRNVRIVDCEVSNVAGIVNITGYDDDTTPTPPRTQVRMSGGTFTTNPELGGPGRFCLIGRGPESFIIEGMTIQHHGSSFIDCSDKSSIDVLSVTGCTWNYGSYGIRIGGYNHGDNQLGIIKSITIEGNTISGAHSSFKSRYPNNTYVGTYAESAKHRRSVEWEDEERRTRGAY